ncbi:hypothetical protein D3C75_1209930 [compost metagenome]
MLLTMVTEVFGVKGKLGDLLLQPKLMKDQFDQDGKASIRTVFAERGLDVVYSSTSGAEYGECQIHSVMINGAEVTLQRVSEGVLIPRCLLAALPEGEVHLLQVELA